LVSGYLEQHGIGVIQMELHDADDPAERTSAISYLPQSRCETGTQVRQLVNEYDPQREFLLHVVMDGMSLTRRLSLADFRERPQPKEEVLGG
jgi:hypothetical protein